MTPEDEEFLTELYRNLTKQAVPPTSPLYVALEEFPQRRNSVIPYIYAKYLLICMRTTLQLDDEHVMQAKISADRGCTPASARRSRRADPSASVGVHQPGTSTTGVNLDDSAGRLDLIDGSR